MSQRKVPNSVSDYLRSLKEVREIFGFIQAEIMDKESRIHLRKMTIFCFFVLLFQALTPATIGKIFSGLAAKSLDTILIGIGSTVLCMLVQKMCERKMAVSREWILSIHWGNLDRRMTELFFEKSPGQHIQESALTVSSIDKGRWNLLALQSLIFFDAMPVMNQLLISLALIVYVSMSAGVFMGLAVCLYVGYSVYLNYHIMRIGAPLDKSMRKLNRKRAERMEKAIRVIVSSQTKREVAEMTTWFNRDAEQDRNLWIWFIKQATWRSLINIILFAIVVVYGSWLVWIGTWEVGFLFPLIMWSIRIIENIWQLSSIEHKINWSLPSVKNMIKALSIVPDARDIENPLHLSSTQAQKIIVDSLSHSYPLKERDFSEEDDDPDEEEKKDVDEEISHTLKKVGFEIEPGEKVALLGPSGAGKTTIMRLLLRFMDPIEGSISVGGTDLRHVAKDSWMKCIGYIAQNPEVFDGTIRDNLTYRLSDEERAKISDDDLWDLMRRLEIDFGKRLDKGLDTKVGKHGLKLSGGQAQRLMIGAAVIGKPWFMVIDEATSSLDSTTEKKVQQGLSEILSDSTTSALIVAHRLSTVRRLCSKFVVLKPAEKVVNGDSQVEAVGSSFEELYVSSPTFRELADDQGIHIETLVRQ